eukprot:gene3488-3984_t
MKPTYIVVVFVLVLLTSSATLAIDGEFDPTARCEPYSGYSFCQGRLKNPASIYVNDTYGQIQMEEKINNTLTLIGFAPDACKVEESFVFLCNMLFTECVREGSFALTVRPCRDNCEAVNTRCNQLTAPYLGCDQESGLISAYPVTSNQYDINGVIKTVNCLDTSNINTNGSHEIPAGTCPSPLLFRNSTDRAGDTERGYTFIADSNCILPCPLPIYSMEQYDQLQKMVDVVAIVSFIATFFCVFTFVILNRKYDRHMFGVVFLSISMFLMMVADVVFVGRGFEIVCPEPGRYARQHDAGCSSTGIIYQFGAVSCLLWWSSMSFDLWLVIKKVTTAQSYVKIYSVVIFGIALILTVAPLFPKQYGYSYGGLGCWMMSDAWQNGTFWIPLFITLAIGVIFIVLIIIEVRKIVNAVKDIKQSGKGKNSRYRLLKMNLRPFLVVLVICCQFIYLFIYHFYVQHNMPRYTANMEKYVMCLASGGGDTCTVSALPFPAQFAFMFFLRFLGCEVFLLYGVSSRTAKIWRESWLMNNKYYRIFKARVSFLSGGTGGSSQRQNSSNNFNTSAMSIRAASSNQDDTGNISNEETTPNTTTKENEQVDNSSENI